MTRQTNPLAELAATMQLLALQPQSAQLWCRVGFLYLKIFELTEALDTFRAAQQIDQNLADAFYGEAIALQQLGSSHEALRALEHAMSRNPQDQRLFSAYAYLCSAAESPPEKTVAAYKTWAQRFTEPARPQFPPRPHNRTADEKLRIGYVSSDFRQHAVMDFFAPILAHHNREKFSVIAFSNGIADERTAAIRRQFDFWNDIRTLNDQAAADLIKKRGIDVLVDLSGHTEGNRLGVFARQPAAVQFTWFGYNGTTGMGAFDGRLTDIAMDPPGNEFFATEPLLRLPCFATFQPPADAPEISDPPYQRNGYITFGSLNNAQKLSDSTLKTWSILLQKIPTAHLLLIGPHAPTAGIATQQIILQRFAAHDLPMERVSLLPRQSLADFLALGKHIDIALEPFPLSGGVTTAQALWMGLPVVTLAGKLPCERAAAAILAAAKRSEWTSHSITEYLNIATTLAAKPQQLAGLRRTQREWIMNSPLLSPTEQVLALETFFQNHWNQKVSTA